MEQLVVFRDRQELDPADLNGIETIARTSLDRIVREAVTSDARYAGLQVAAATVTSVSVGPGAFFNEGRVYAVSEPAPINLYENLPINHRRYIAIVASGQDDVNDRVEERDFLIDADSDEVEPQAVPMRTVRLGGVSKVVGTENIDPQVPTIPPGAILVATVLMSTSGIQSVKMHEETRLPSLKRHAERLIDLDNFRKRAEPQIGALTTQLANIADRTEDKLDREELLPMQLDLARIKERVNLPDDYYDYGSDKFTDADETDPASASGHTIAGDGLGFASVTATRALSLLNPTDPKVKRYEADWIQPSYSPKVMLEVLGESGTITMSSYQTQGADTQKAVVSRKEVKYQGFMADYVNRQLDAGRKVRRGITLADGSRGYYYITKEYKDVTTYVTVPGPVTTHTGAQLSQTVLAPRTFVMSQLGFFLAELDASGDVTVLVTKTKDGKPDLDAVINRVTVARANLIGGGETVAAIQPTLLEAGQLYAFVFITQGGHKITVAEAGSTEGQFYYGQDGAWVSTDATRDVKLKLYANKFDRTRTEVALGTVTLAGGISDISWGTDVIEPEGTQIYLEARKAGHWYTLYDHGFLDDEPDTLELRAVFVGTSDLQPSLKLGADLITLHRVGDTIEHLSTARILAAGKQNFVVDLHLTNYSPDDPDQDLTVTLKRGAGYATTTTASAEVVEDDILGTKRVRFSFNTGTPITSYKIAISGSRQAPAFPFLVLERVDVAIS
ncbi:hypothetical protein GCM10007989_04910 [Devosia pacifica]|uniref:DUF4815 domain-containing protein n=1 Tax=Devosia pacifica TaxID=1335967 RepID=A0A918RY86_9HYPH|nr:hypothetical protein [Devosia pacifica]GHA13333.1 hypothetical protein GCM10007989_04910 [Devosia pacifica]